MYHFHSTEGKEISLSISLQHNSVLSIACYIVTSQSKQERNITGRFLFYIIVSDY